MPTDKPKTRSRSGPIAALVLVAMLVGYPLSFGPSWWLYRRGYLSSNAIIRGYAPVYWLCEHSSLIAEVQLWYVSKWEPDTFAPDPFAPP